MYNSLKIRCFKKARRIDPVRMEEMDVYGVVLWHLKKDVELSNLGADLQELDSNAPETLCVIGNLYRYMKNLIG